MMFNTFELFSCAGEHAGLGTYIFLMMLPCTLAMKLKKWPSITGYIIYTFHSAAMNVNPAHPPKNYRYFIRFSRSTQSVMWLHIHVVLPMSFNTKKNTILKV